MNETQPLPTDAELWQLHMQMPGAYKDPIAFARAVLAKWGSPVVAGEPVAWMALLPSGSEVFARTRDFYPDAVPVFTTLQPTQAQAGAVPLTDPQLVACIEAAGFKTWDNRMWALKRAIESAHGIKEGGQHG